MIKYLAPGAEGHGTEKVIEAVHKQSGRIKPMVVPIKLDRYGHHLSLSEDRPEKKVPVRR